MPRLNPVRWWRTFLALPNTSSFKAIGVVFAVALVCSVFVSLTAVTLKPLQDANRLRETATSLIEVVDRLGGGTPRARLVELSSGFYTNRDPGTQIEIEPENDIAGLGTLETVATVYELYERNQLKLVILPVRGSGYQSVLKGHLALESDLNTVAALTFHEQGETPGMGARIGESEWQALWADKQVADESGAIRIEVVRGNSADIHQVDGISGATRTGSGVTDLVHFWLGPKGYGPYLARLKREAGQ